MDLAALRAYAAAQQTAASAGPGGGDEVNAAQGAAFTDMLTSAVEQTEATMRAAEQMTASAAVGQAEMVDVVTAVAAAEVQLETVVSVRDQVIRAYQEILRMPI